MSAAASVRAASYVVAAHSLYAPAQVSAEASVMIDDIIAAAAALVIAEAAVSSADSVTAAPSSAAHCFN